MYPYPRGDFILPPSEAAQQIVAETEQASACSVSHTESF